MMKSVSQTLKGPLILTPKSNLRSQITPFRTSSLTSSTSSTSSIKSIKFESFLQSQFSICKIYRGSLLGNGFFVNLKSELSGFLTSYTVFNSIDDNVELTIRFQTSAIEKSFSDNSQILEGSNLSTNELKIVLSNSRFCFTDEILNLTFIQVEPSEVSGATFLPLSNDINVNDNLLLIFPADNENPVLNGTVQEKIGFFLKTSINVPSGATGLPLVNEKFEVAGLQSEGNDAINIQNIIIAINRSHLCLATFDFSSKFNFVPTASPILFSNTVENSWLLKLKHSWFFTVSSKSLIQDGSIVLQTNWRQLHSDYNFSEKLPINLISFLQTVVFSEKRVTFSRQLPNLSLASLNLSSEESIYLSLFQDIFFTSDQLNKFEMKKTSLIVILPTSVSKITDRLFEGFTRLESVSFPKSIQSIGVSCFSGCSNLVTIGIPDSITEIGASSFRGCSSLKNITLPSISCLSSNLFENCSSITQIDIPFSIREIKSFCFKRCSSLNEIELPPFLQAIGVECFSHCTSLLQIFLPPTLLKLESGLFEGCSSLVQISFSESTKTIGAKCFSKCKSLSVVELPHSLVELGSECFSGCVSLVEIFIPKTLETIGQKCFSGCEKLFSSSGEVQFEEDSNLTLENLKKFM